MNERPIDAGDGPNPRDEERSAVGCATGPDLESYGHLGPVTTQRRDLDLTPDQRRPADQQVQGEPGDVCLVEAGRDDRHQSLTDQLIGRVVPEHLRGRRGNGHDLVRVIGGDEAVRRGRMPSRANRAVRVDSG